MRILVVAFVVGLVGCKKPVDKGEVAAINAERGAALKAREARCVRPVLRGTALEGAGDRAIRAATDGGSGALDAVRKAVSHGSACNPWREGKLESGRLLELPKLGERIAAKAAEVGGDEGVRWLLDGLRFSQDVGRGGNLLDAMVGVAVAKPLLAAAKDALAGQPAARWKGEVERLIASEPHFHAVVADEILSMQRMILQGMEEDDPALLLAAYDDGSKLVLKACPNGSADDVCVSGLKAFEQDMEKTSLSPDVRKQAGKQLGRVAFPSFVTHHEKYVKRRKALEALRDGLL